jgi:hypothetical protein
MHMHPSVVDDDSVRGALWTDDRYTGPALFEVMEGIADGIATTSLSIPSALLLAKRPVLGKTRVCVLRRAGSSVRRAGAVTGSNHAGVSGAIKESEQGEEAGIVVVVALIQSGTMRQGQALEALLPGSRLLAHHHASRKTWHVTNRPSMMARYRVVSIERFDKSMYAPICACTHTHTHTHTHTRE